MRCELCGYFTDLHCWNPIDFCRGSAFVSFFLAFYSSGALHRPVLLHPAAAGGPRDCSNIWAWNSGAQEAAQALEIDYAPKWAAAIFDDRGARKHGFLERSDIEEWIASSPDVLGEDLLVLKTEHIIPDNKLRIDILALDTNGNIVVVELKRDWSGSGLDWQAIKYASYCQKLTVERLCQLLAERENIQGEGTRPHRRVH